MLGGARSIRPMFAMSEKRGCRRVSLSRLRSRVGMSIDPVHQSPEWRRQIVQDYRAPYVRSLDGQLVLEPIRAFVVAAWRVRQPEYSRGLDQFLQFAGGLGR